MNSFTEREGQRDKYRNQLLSSLGDEIWSMRGDCDMKILNPKSYAEQFDSRNIPLRAPVALVITSLDIPFPDLFMAEVNCWSIRNDR